MIMISNECYERSSRLPVEKNCSFIFCPCKGFRTRAYKNRLGVLKVFFLRRHKPNIIFGWTTRVDSDRKCNTLIYKIIQIVRALWSAKKASYMSVCKRGFRSPFVSYFIKEMQNGFHVYIAWCKHLGGWEKRFLHLSRVLPTSRMFTSGYANMETILHLFIVSSNSVPSNGQLKTILSLMWNYCPLRFHCLFRDNIFSQLNWVTLFYLKLGQKANQDF